MASRTVAAAALLILPFGQSIHAQGTDEAAVLLRDRLRPGDHVTLSGRDAVVEGTLVALTRDALLVRTSSGETTVPFTTVNEAHRKRMGIKLGVIIGAVAGITPGVLAAIVTDDAKAIPGNIALGAAIGAGIDAMWNRNRRVYRRGAASETAITPVIGPDIAFVRVSTSW